MIALYKLGWDNAARMQTEYGAPLPHTAAMPTRNMTFDDDNRLTAIDGNTVTMDLDGNMTSGPLTNDTVVNYTFDARSRLISAGGLSYGYDPAGNRTVITNGATVTKYVINPNANLSQTLMRIQNGVTNYYIYGAGLLYQITEAATATNTLTYHYDYRGSTVALTDDSGNVTDRIEYSAYAAATYRSGTNDTPFLFNGMYGVMTDANGLMYMRARYYNPFICRFINPDPSGFSGGLNFYAYADGNPISFLDPFGLWSWTQTFGVVRAIGGLAEASAGVALGAATSWTGGGAIAGGLVAYHGFDQFVAGVRQAYNNAPADTVTSQTLQAVGVPQQCANSIDAGLSIAGSFGAGAVATGIRATQIAADPLAAGMSTGQMLDAYEQGSVALNNADYWGLGGDFTSPLYKAAQMSSGAYPLTTTIGTELAQGAKLFLNGSGLTPNVYPILGGVGAASSAVSWTGNTIQQSSTSSH